MSHHRARRIEIHSTAHSAAKLPASSSSISGNHHHSISASRGTDEKTSIRPGPST